MKRIQKIVIMISVLLAPIFVFLFLKQYGTNKFEVPVYYTNGNPIAECSGAIQQHKLNPEILIANDIDLPVLIYLPATEQIEYYSDLNNVLSKYKSVDVRALILEGSVFLQEGIQSISLSMEEYNKYINCQLILGEDQWLQEAITNKFVLVDNSRRIRGYYNCNKLDEIERLETELDILLNY